MTPQQRQRQIRPTAHHRHYHLILDEEVTSPIGGEVGKFTFFDHSHQLVKELVKG